MLSETKTIAFAAVVCLVCSIFLAGTRASLEGRIAFNEENDRKLNVLRAFHPEALPDGTPLSPEDYVSYFDEGNLPPALIDQYFKFIETIFIDLEGNVLEGKTESDFDRKALADKTRSPLPLYVWRENDQIKKYAFPMYGKGLWSTIYSYISLKPDLAEIKGVTFYGHKETPGLGGEASKPWFQRNFIGKKLYEDGKPSNFIVAKGRVSTNDPNISHSVDGLAGATITAKGIQKFINADFAVYNRYFDQIRGN